MARISGWALLKNNIIYKGNAVQCNSCSYLCGPPYVGKFIFQQDYMQVIFFHVPIN